MLGAAVLVVVLPPTVSATRLNDSRVTERRQRTEDERNRLELR
ncbi:hypothetical protein [Amycolatopsis thermoflava]|uniref:Uncharacterized protein n=1 Tax=Amycolatopsis thermoflava TaxID=84480 RepID=A0A3N2GX92_9PSEU|nr:hypothetical protein [Amycolatopsis thermoflava]ROS41264.1 hypothetical protein EDD35_3619 [Amycolatopsis thermoflava]